MAVFLPKDWRATALAAPGSRSTTLVQKKLPKNWKAMTLADCRKMAESEGTADVDEGMAGLRIADNGVTLV